jgi:hypothetical protein
MKSTTLVNHIVMTVSKNNMWASHGLDRFCVRPYSKLGPEFQVRQDWALAREYDVDIEKYVSNFVMLIINK